MHRYRLQCEPFIATGEQWRVNTYVRVLLEINSLTDSLIPWYPVIQCNTLQHRGVRRFHEDKKYSLHLAEPLDNLNCCQSWILQCIQIRTENNSFLSTMCISDHFGSNRIGSMKYMFLGCRLLSPLFSELNPFCYFLSRCTFDKLLLLNWKYIQCPKLSFSILYDVHLGNSFRPTDLIIAFYC